MRLIRIYYLHAEDEDGDEDGDGDIVRFLQYTWLMDGLREASFMR